MKLTQMQIKEFVDFLASDAPAPGGGSASALVGAEGVALFMMVANLTVGKAKYAEFEALNRTALEKGNALLTAMIESIDKDAEAFNVLSAAFKLPKGTDEDRNARSARIAEATLNAAQVPFDVMKIALDALKQTHTLVGKSNVSAAGDLGVAAQCLLTCLKGAWLNVKINLSGVKVPSKAEEFQKEGEKMPAEAEALAEEIYAGVIDAL